MRYTLEDDNFCFVCGENNPCGFHLKFSLEDGKAVTEFSATKVYQGYKDIVHGGIISTLLDETMVKVALLQGIPAITAEITVRLRNPLMVGEKAIIEATILRMNKKVIEVSSRMEKQDKTLIAEGYAKLVRQD